MGSVKVQLKNEAEPLDVVATRLSVRNGMLWIWKQKDVVMLAPVENVLYVLAGDGVEEN